MAVCRETVPPHFPVPDHTDHWAACWLYAEEVR
jgi:hypothetical protein